MTLGERILELRKEKGLSQEGLGEALGVSRQAVSKWESDGGIPELDTLIAMSRLFGITLGQLLGVESSGFLDLGAQADERAEEILRRYVQAAEQQKSAHRRKRNLGIVVAAAVAAVGLLWAGVAIGDQVRTLQNTIGNMEDELSSLENQVGTQILGIAGEGEEILTSEDRLERSFQWEVLGFDQGAQTVQLKLTARLKEEVPEQTVQFVVDWTDTSMERSGQVLSKILPGPAFTDLVEVPMNGDTQVSMLIRDGSGTVLEQKLTTIYEELESDNFDLTVEQPYWAPLELRIGGVVQAAETQGIRILSDYPDLIGHHHGEREWGRSGGVPAVLYPVWLWD